MLQIKFHGVLCDVRFMPYRNDKDREAIELSIAEGEDAGEQMLVATVNLPNQPISKGNVFIKDYSENEGILEVLVSEGILSSPLYYTSSGHASISVCRILKRE